ncbi:transcription antitermination factor NusB [Alloiococcus sp. CFN-8]|uniref:transcription antitermination factor NusB n=1 Tax=Alloiococcus sp. CFN-8 TaxID=3416081 RepID=UPI003CE6A730
MNRKKSREVAMKIIFEGTFNSRPIEEIMEEADFFNEDLDTNTLDMNFIKKIVTGINENIEAINGIIEENSDNWKLNRISKINLAILKVAIYEMVFSEDTPEPVAINEAVELSKQYSDDKSVSFINAVLDRIYKSKG